MSGPPAMEPHSEPQFREALSKFVPSSQPWTDLWNPQPGPQTAFISCPAPEIFYGGARAGGKTDGVIGKWALKERRYGRNFNAIMFRRTTVSAEDAIERSRQIYGPLGG